MAKKRHSTTANEDGGELTSIKDLSTGDHNDASISQSSHGKKRRLHTYEKARVAYENVSRNRQLAKQEAEKRHQQRAEAIERYKVDKRKKMKTMYKRTKKGQPKLGKQVEYLLSKIERSVTSNK